MKKKSLSPGEETTTDGNGKGHTNLIGDSCLASDIKQNQKKIHSTGGKPVLQFIRQNANQISRDNLTLDQIDKKQINDIQADISDSANSRESTPDTFLAAGSAERAFFSVCLEGNNDDAKGVEERDHLGFSDDVASKEETNSLDDDDKATSIKVVKAILGEIEIDHQQQQMENNLNRASQKLIDINETDAKCPNANNTPVTDEMNEGKDHAKQCQSLLESCNTSDKNSDNEKFKPNAKIINNRSRKINTHGIPHVNNLSGNMARSLVVDIHIPPSEGGNFFNDETNKEIEETQESDNIRKEDNSFRPFKHEINRSQRCYSDTSHLDKKRKHKVKLLGDVSKT